jgi:hypothetical protein
MIKFRIKAFDWGENCGLCMCMYKDGVCLRAVKLGCKPSKVSKESLINAKRVLIRWARSRSKSK